MQSAGSTWPLISGSRASAGEPGQEAGDRPGHRGVCGDDVTAGMLEDQRVGEPVGQQHRVAPGHDRVGAADDVDGGDAQLVPQQAGVLRPAHDNCGEMSWPPGTPSSFDSCGRGSGCPSVTEVLVSWNEGTAGLAVPPATRAVPAPRPHAAVPAVDQDRARPAGALILDAHRALRSHDLVLLHGQPGSAADWLPLTSLLPGTLRAVAADRPGYGASPLPPAGFAGGARAVLADLDARGIQRAVLVGHSYGGGVSLSVARLAPHRVEALVLLASVGPGCVNGWDRLLAAPVAGPARAGRLAAHPLDRPRPAGADHPARGRPRRVVYVPASHG